jgi:hypothetical protein
MGWVSRWNRFHLINFCWTVYCLSRANVMRILRLVVVAVGNARVYTQKESGLDMDIIDPKALGAKQVSAYLHRIEPNYRK